MQNVIDTNFVAADRMAVNCAISDRAGAGCIVNVTTMLKTMTKSTSSLTGLQKPPLRTRLRFGWKDLEGTGVRVNILNPAAQPLYAGIYDA